MKTRRDALRVMGVAAAGAAAVSVAARRDATKPLESGPPAAPELLGAQVNGARVTKVSPVVDGALSLELVTTQGTTFVVDVLRHHPDCAPGVARTESLALYLRNNGNGKMATHEEHGLATMALASHLAPVEARLSPQLLTFSERLAILHRRRG